MPSGVLIADIVSVCCWWVIKCSNGT